MIPLRFVSNLIARSANRHTGGGARRLGALAMSRLAVPVVAVIVFTACNPGSRQSAQMEGPPDACAIVLSPPAGGKSRDEQIDRLQGVVREARNAAAKLERLGWVYVSRARTTHDPGYYKLAEQTAACIEKSNPDSTAALLLRGHVRQNLHQFEEAERIARRLVAKRASPFDYGLLGDALMEQGRLEEAAAAYQKMVDLRPGLESYSRGAHLRWLYGDLEGATGLMRLAARAGGSRNAEPTAWAYARLAQYELQSRQFERAMQAARAALELQPQYAPALLVEGRILLAKGESQRALEPISQAARRNPLPEYQWLLADVLRVVGQDREAAGVESELEQLGAIEDPRTFSLYLATRGRKSETALRLAEKELENRSDVFTYDALAWSLRAAGQTQRASQAMRSALSGGTQDARLFLHAAVIFAASGEAGDAARFRRKAESLRYLLSPSELAWLKATHPPPTQEFTSS